MPFEPNARSLARSLVRTRTAGIHVRACTGECARTDVLIHDDIHGALTEHTIADPDADVNHVISYSTAEAAAAAVTTTVPALAGRTVTVTVEARVTHTDTRVDFDFNRIMTALITLSRLPSSLPLYGDYKFNV